jgi:hypothetical protein
MTGRAFGVPRLVNIAVGSFGLTRTEPRFEATALNHARPAENKEVESRKEGSHGKDGMGKADDGAAYGPWIEAPAGPQQVLGHRLSGACTPPRN